jgi:ribonucleoside-diphosphate reductase alpha chain
MTELEQYFKGDELASSVWRGKYAAKGENTPDDMHRRMAKEFARIEDNYLDSDASFFEKGTMSDFWKRMRPLEEDVIYEYFKDFKYIVPQGSIMSILGNQEYIGSLSNCFVIGQPHDSYGGILQKDQELVQLMKRRGGVGIDLSTLRPSNTKVTNAAGTSTGMASFMHRYSNSTREVAQNGRRGALMISSDIRHPDILEFINSKRDLTKVTGANISVMLRDDFMYAVAGDRDYLLRFPCNTEFEDFSEDNVEEFESQPYGELKQIGENSFIKRIKAREYFDKLVENNWFSAEPGSIFIDRHWNYSPDGVYSQYRGITTNPCGEIFMQMYDACRLLAMNLFSFVKNPFTKKSEIDFDKLYEVAYVQQRLADNLVDLELEHIDRILAKIDKDDASEDIKKTERDLWQNIRRVAGAGRRTGCGFTGLGDMLAALGLKYDSKKAKQIIDLVMATKMRAELDCTIDLSILRGSFEGWNPELEIGNAPGIGWYAQNDFYKMLLLNFNEQLQRMQKYGRRNVSWSTVAPTGTVSIMTQTTSGLEPLFAAFYLRNKKVNPGDIGARVDFVDQNGDSWMTYPVLHPKFREWLLANSNIWMTEMITSDEHSAQLLDNISKTQLEEAYEKSPWFESCAEDIDWLQRVEIQGIIQKYTTHSISSTINLPEDVSKEKIAEIYMTAWKKGLKGVTVYRDKCRTGVLVTEDKKKPNFEYKDSAKRPKELDGELHVVTVKGQRYGVVIGAIEGNPYEVFAFEMPDEAKQGCKGKVVKMKKGHYTFRSDCLTMDDIQSEAVRNDEQVLTRLISGMLRHGAKPQFVMEQIDKCNLEIVSFGKAVSRVLKKYVKDEELINRSVCDNCGSSNLKREEGCLSCNDCGHSKCG